MSEPELCEDEGCPHHGTPHVCIEASVAEIATQNLQNAWAALAMIREAIETLGPVGILPSQEAVLGLHGPEFVHEATVIVEAIQRLAGNGCAEEVSAPSNATGTVQFLEEAARYFETRPTHGEDAAHWANVQNAANCRKAAALLKELEAEIREPRLHLLRDYREMRERAEKAEAEVARLSENQSCGRR